MTAPLENITVVEVDNWMAAPSTGAILADLGARVIKIEPAEGDPMRDTGRSPKVENDDLKNYDLQFDVDNRGKQSVCINLTDPAGVSLVHKMCVSADIFMCNLLSQRQEKYRFDPATLLEVNPKLVHATLTGYGTSGPEAWRPGYDVTAFFGRSGLYDAMREGSDGIVPMARPAQGDHTTGLALLGAILAALRLAEKTGEGQIVETSLFETAVWTQATDYATSSVDLAPVRQRARNQMFLPTANRYPCGDGKWVVFNMPEASAWPKFCKAIGRGSWVDEERFVDPKSRFRLMHEIVPMVDEALSAKTRDEWGEIFDAAGLIWGPVLGLHEVPEDSQAEAINLFPVLDHETLGQYRTVSIPMRFQSADVKPRGRSPLLGEHTYNVLQDFGVSDSEIESLTQQGVIAQFSQEE
ncbi:MAG: CoA transferase [Gammaproteobacteria bacterium]|nr:CoA transferase [Gammaproteobacteria bacterium]